MDNKDTGLATELLQELKSSSKRWFIAFCVMVALELSTIAGFMWYISLPAEECSTTQSLEDIDGNNINQIGGDMYGEGYSDND